MAKKRRKPSRPRNRPQAGTTRTAERPIPAGGTDVDTEPDAQPGPRPASHPSRPTGPQRTRAEKKELARQEREAVRRRMARARRARQILMFAGLGLAVAVGVFLFSNRGGTQWPGSLPGELTTRAPWDANAGQSAARAQALGLPAEGTTMHEHANVQIFVHGEREPVPTDIGIDQSAGTIQSIHTHDDTGTVHLESSESREFLLGEFFGVWGVRFTPSCLGAYCNNGTNSIRVFLDGDEVTGDPRDVQMDDLSVIVVTYGTQKELPDPIPDTFDFRSVPP